MLGQARKKIARHNWSNVSVIESPLERAELPLAADALLFPFTHDIFQIPAAVRSAIKKVKVGGRVVAICTHWNRTTAPRGATAVIDRLSRRYLTTLEGLDEPWRPVEEELTNVTFHRYWVGTMYVASGRRRRRPSGDARSATGR